MDKLSIKAAARAKGKVNKLRKDGLLPAVLYGHKVQNQSLSVNANEFEKLLKKAGESTIVELLTDDGKAHPVLIHDVQNHYLYSTPEHVDFYEVNMSEKLKAAVVLEFTGESEAVKNLGGTLVRVLNEVEVECLPADLPHNIEVDISSLKTFEEAIHVSNLKVSNKVEILTASEEVVAKVQPPRDVEAELAVEATDEQAAVEATVAASTEVKEETAEGEAEKPAKE